MATVGSILYQLEKTSRHHLKKHFNREEASNSGTTGTGATMTEVAKNLSLEAVNRCILMKHCQKDTKLEAQLNLSPRASMEKLLHKNLQKKVLFACVSVQMDVIKSFNDTEGPQWKYSLFGNLNDPETLRIGHGGEHSLGCLETNERDRRRWNDGTLRMLQGARDPKLSFVDVVKGEKYKRLYKSKNENKVSGDALLKIDEKKNQSKRISVTSTETQEKTMALKAAEYKVPGTMADDEDEVDDDSEEEDSEERELFETSDGESSWIGSDMELERSSGDTIIKDSFQNPTSHEDFYEKVDDDRGMQFETFHYKNDKDGIEEINPKHAENLKACSTIQELIQEGNSVHIVNAVNDAGDIPNSPINAIHDAGGNLNPSPAREREMSDSVLMGNTGITVNDAAVIPNSQKNLEEEVRDPDNSCNGERGMVDGIITFGGDYELPSQDDMMRSKRANSY
ncbi:hypothetical protein L2E82_22524 [Cichorium intybus]|uniref:Uncharacterized protein n=1 Tax=Cichorium intybus TaxID=13427 RepID=A0ACB9DYD1_CICIN|nr:hypothetical protein L2E82_22524 [Cichorium intybus]